MLKEQTFEHPSYVQVAFSRRQGNPKLFGSVLETHYNYVTLQIKKTELIRGEHGDRYFSSIHGDIVEVDLSAAQFSELLTTMNIGCGVPGTLRRLLGKAVEEPPDLPSEVEGIRDNFSKELKGFVRGIMESSLPRAKTILAKPSLTKADRAELIGILESVSNKLSSTTPFILELFNESVSKRVTAAKTEIDSLFAVILRKAGLKALGSDAPKELNAGE